MLKNLKRDLGLIFNHKELLPKYIQAGYHLDWWWWLRWVKRSWTSFPLPFPPRKWIGNAEEEWMDVNWMKYPKSYPMADDAQVADKPNTIFSIHPVHPPGYWSIQSMYLFGKRIPCYFTATFILLGLNVHVNFGVKPDLTDWHFAFPEASLTIKKKNDPA